MDNEMLSLMHEDGEIDDKFLILHDAHQRRTLHGGLPYWKYDRFTLENLQEEECEVDFRFKKQYIYRLAAAFTLPDTFKCSNGTKVQSIEAWAFVYGILHILADMQILYLGLVGQYQSCA